MFQLPAALAVTLTCSLPAIAQELERAMSVEREVQRIARSRELWPGFEPLRIPLAVFTGDSTYLFRHPAPPHGFAAVPRTADPVHAYRGRHPAVTSNSSAEMGGVATATVLADGARASRRPVALAAVALHEAFHVHQRTHHPGWSGNEGDLLLYPVADSALLALRRLESAALRRALGAVDSAIGRCWTREALSARAQRFVAMDSAFVAYERLSELNEGIASYVQMRAAGHAIDTIPADGFAPSAVRARVYATGPALGALLDRFRPGWQSELERQDQWLDAMLDEALGSTPAAGNACQWDDAERQRISRAAARDAAAVMADRSQRRRDFDEQPGWRLIVRSAEGRPLWPQGFDPLNVELVDGGVLHARFIELGSDDGRLRMLDDADSDLTALTTGAGAHPLFNGIREVQLAGLARPDVTRGADTMVTIRAPGLTATFPRATIEERGTTIIVRLAPTP